MDDQEPESLLVAMPDLIRAIADVRLAGRLLVGTPAQPRVMEAITRLLRELYRLRNGAWIDAAAREIAIDPRCCDPKSANAEAIAATIRRFVVLPDPPA